MSRAIDAKGQESSQVKLRRMDAKTLGDAERKLARMFRKFPDDKIEVWVAGRLAYRVRRPTKQEQAGRKDWRQEDE